MSNREWIRQEVPKWVSRHLITDEEAKNILSQYKKGGHSSWGEPFFLLAVICLFGGIVFGFAGLWNDLSQDQRFMLGLVPMVISLLILLGLILWDRKIPDPVEEEQPPKDEDLFSFGSVSDSHSGRSALAKLSAMRGALGRLATAPPKRRRTYHHSIPSYIIETAGGIHGLCLLMAVWIVMDSFKLSDNYYTMAAVCALIQLVLMYVTQSAALGIFTLISACLTFSAAPFRGWPEVWAWIILLGALPALPMMLRDRREKAFVVFSWVWALAVFFLIFWSAANMLWQTMFFSIAAAITWMMGSIFRPYGFASESFRFFGGTALYAVMLEGSFGRVWSAPSGNAGLWTILIVFLLADLVLAIRMIARREWLSFWAGLGPIALFIALITSLFEPTGALSASLVSAYSVLLGIAVAARGIETGRVLQRWAGIGLLMAVGVIRIGDSALTFSQRGAFFALIGAAAAAICFLMYILRGGRKKRRKPVKKPVKRDMSKPPVPPDLLPEHDEKGGPRHG
jgi:hypothetical protein